MRFRERSAWITLVSILVASLWYVARIVSQAATRPVSSIDLGWPALSGVVALVVTIAAAHIWIAARDPDAALRLVTPRRSPAFVILSAGACVAAGLTLAGTDAFWIFNVLVGALVASETAIAVSQITNERKGEAT